jgi:hypothetical protein
VRRREERRGDGEIGGLGAKRGSEREGTARSRIEGTPIDKCRRAFSIERSPNRTALCQPWA